MEPSAPQIRFLETLQSFLKDSQIKLGNVLIKFIIACVNAIVYIKGRVNFLQLARFSDLNEKTFRNNFKKHIDWFVMNSNIAKKEFPNPEETCVVFDPAHLGKAGNCTAGIGEYWSGVASAVKHGLEITAFAVVNLVKKRTFMLGAVQTLIDATTTMTDFYIQSIKKYKDEFLKLSKNLCADAFFSRKEYVDAILAMGFNFISRFPSNFVFLYHATEEYLQQRGIKRGRKPKYAGRVDIQNPDNRFMKPVKIDGAISAWTGVVESHALERDVRIVIVKDKKDKKTVVFFSTDTDMKPETIVSIYRLRFQIEFGIRDSRQFTGLHHSQARGKERLDFAFNVSFFTRNVLQTEIDHYFPKFSVGQLKKTLSEEEFALKILHIAVPEGVNSHIMKKINDLIATHIGVAA